MVDPQVFVGVTVAMLCCFGLTRHRWIVEHTTKGHRLSARFGKVKARWIVQCLFAAGVLFGGALASGLINPLRWN